MIRRCPGQRVINFYPVCGAVSGAPPHRSSTAISDTGLRLSLVSCLTGRPIGITAHTGFPRADRGDFAKAAYPFSSSTTFTRTFKIP